MTRDEALEALLLVQYVALVIGALLLARLAHVGAAHLLRSLKPPLAPGEYLHLLVVFLPIWVFAAERLGIHRIHVVTGPRTELARRLILTQAWGLAAVALILVAAQTSLNRSLIGIFFLLSTALLLAASSLQRRFVARRRGESLVMVIGEVADEALGEIERARGRRVARRPFSGPAELGERLREDPVDEVVLSESLSAEDTRCLVELMSEHGIATLVPLSRGVDGFPPPQVEPVGRAQYLLYQRRRPSVPSLVIKAICDWLLAALLLVVLSPFLLLLALVVRVVVGSPLLYVQRRGGLYGRPFSMLKFRTMRVGAEAERAALLAQNEMDGPVFKLTHDPRVTPFGRLLAAIQPRRAAAALQRAPRPDEPGRPASAAGRGDRGADGGTPAAALDAPGADLLLAGGGAERAAVQGMDGARSRLCRPLEPGSRSGHPAPDAPGHCQGARGALRRDSRNVSSDASTKAPKRRSKVARSKRWAAARSRAGSNTRRSSRSTAAASASGVGSAKSTPVSPSRTESSEPPAAKATTGRPAARASTGTMPKSSSAGWTTARQAA